MKHLSRILSTVSVLLIALFAQARPGGGGGFSSGGGGGGFSSGGGGGFGFSSGGSGGSGEFSWPMLLIFGGAVVAFYIFKHILKNKEGQTVTSSSNQNYRMMQMTQSDVQLQQFKRTDPNFSKTLFLDFAHLLYTKYLHWFGEPEIKTLQPFLSDDIFALAQRKAPFNVTEIVVGSLRIREIGYLPESSQPYIEVEIVANYTKVGDGHSIRNIVTERWKFAPIGDWPTPGSVQPDAINCPNCGAAVAFNDSGNCESCGTLLSSGKMNWKVLSKVMVKADSFSTGNLTTYAQEVGTEDPTITQPSLQSNIQAFSAAHQIADWYAFEKEFTTKVVQTTFMEIYQAWSEGQWERVRHLVSDRLFESNQFWMDNYKAQGLRNKLDDIAVVWSTVVAIDLDKFYEAFTVRIKASCKDYVVDLKDGKVKGGSPNKDRFFTEYWTFIRRTGVEKDTMELKNCPNCGAQADKMGQSAICGYCGTKVNTGAHSWVLSSITQDEVYAG